MDKYEYMQLVGKRLSDVVEKLGISQRKLLAQCGERDYNISQSSLSKMLSGTSFQTLSVMQVCDVLDIDPAEVLSLNPSTNVHIKKVDSIDLPRIITDARNKVFRGYLGVYCIYFYTTKNEDYIHQGTFKLSESPTTHECIVNFDFKTGQKNEKGEDIEKHYVGKAYYSVSMQTIYCSIESEEIGELSYLLFRYDFLTYQSLECRLAVAITVCSGTHRLPTMHRFLLTRKALSKTSLDYLCGQLKLNSSEILISENAYRSFLKDPNIPQSFFQYFGDADKNAERFVSSVAKVDYYTFNESLISDSFLSPLDKSKIICLLRKYSASSRYNKISDKAEELIYKFLVLQQKEEENINI